MLKKKFLAKAPRGFKNIRRVGSNEKEQPNRIESERMSPTGIGRRVHTAIERSRPESINHQRRYFYRIIELN